MDEVTIYEPGCRGGWGWGAWRVMVGDAWRCRGLAWRLFQRTFTARYRQTLLGMGGAVLAPVLATAAFVLLGRAGVFDPGETAIPYVPYAILSLTLWAFFADGLTACAPSLASHGSLVTRVNFPKELLVLASYGPVLVNGGVRLALTALVFAWYGVMPASGLLLAPLALLPLLLLTMGCGLLLAVANALVRDVGAFLPSALLFLLFVTPVLYAPAQEGVLSTVMLLNPLAGLVSAPRDLIIEGSVAQPVVFAGAALFSLMYFLVCWRLFHLAQPRFAERMGS